jgi:5-methylcytosine-specific restriction endonuclease McrA
MDEKQLRKIINGMGVIPRQGQFETKRHTKFYSDYIQSEAWQRKKAVIIEKRGYKCERCGSVDRLTLHHMTYDRLGCELDVDLRLLCVRCHKIADVHRANRARFEKALETYTFKKYGHRVAPVEVEDEFRAWLERKEGGG